MSLARAYFGVSQYLSVPIAAAVLVLITVTGSFPIYAARRAKPWSAESLTRKCGRNSSSAPSLLVPLRTWRPHVPRTKGRAMDCDSPGRSRPLLSPFPRWALADALTGCGRSFPRGRFPCPRGAPIRCTATHEEGVFHHGHDYPHRDPRCKREQAMFGCIADGGHGK